VNDELKATEWLTLRASLTAAKAPWSKGIVVAAIKI